MHICIYTHTSVYTEDYIYIQRERERENCMRKRALSPATRGCLLHREQLRIEKKQKKSAKNPDAL